MSSEYIGTIAPVESVPPKTHVGVVGWLKQNLFNNWYNSILTVLSLWLLYYALGGMFNWVVRYAVFTGTDPAPCKLAEGACWPLVIDNWQLFMVGTYPLELRYRPLIALIFVLAVIAPAFVGKFRKMRAMHIIWFISPVVVFFIISGSETLGITPVDTRRWGGLLLTMLLSITGIVCAFPFGLLLALGRRSKLPIIRSLCVVGWLKQNLFNNWYNSILTVLSLWLLYYALGGMFNWVVRYAVFTGTDPAPCKLAEGACWPLVIDNWQLFMVGTYPLELRYRPLIALIFVLAVIAPAFVGKFRKMRAMHIIWFISPVVVFFIISGSETLGITPVDTRRWGGLLLTMLLSITGIVCAFPFGLLLALGRRSKLPIIRSLCVVYIELIRGVPLISVLFMASFMLPLFFPAGVTMDKLLRAQIGIIIFAAAYQAETVRGGLQALGKGQEEAAMALGLNYWQTMVFIILPQALRNVIPILVSGAISLLKDTSLVVIIGMFDLIGTANTIVSNPTWLGKHVEAYAFVAGIYWVICFSMSRYASRLEVKFAAGQH